MQSRLIVNNFGPLAHVDLDLRDVNVFIGPQASGKSALAKLFTIFKAPRRFLKDCKNNIALDTLTDKRFYNALEEYNINFFLKPDTEICYESELHSLSYKNNTLTYSPILLNKINQMHDLAMEFDKNMEEIKDLILDIGRAYTKFGYFTKINLSGPANHDTDLGQTIGLLDREKFQWILRSITNVEEDLNESNSLYIPSERSITNIIKGASLNLLLNNVPIPKHILYFGAELEKSIIPTIDLGFLKKGLKYINTHGIPLIEDDSTEIGLLASASGIQSIIPILIPILSAKTHDHKSFVIEEPEMNLFPDAQYELIKFLESHRIKKRSEDSGHIHTYTTHSPYVLAALNNLLYANKVKKHKERLEKEIYEIVSTDIDADDFTAYQISEGRATPILDRGTGLITDNFIDRASDKMADDFDALMELMR